MLTAIHNLMLVAVSTPVPRDIELPLPLSSYELKLFLVLLFLAHILFVNLMVGGSVLSVLFEIIGLSHKRYDSLAKKISETITVNKSLAVVLGVGPLLCISLVYTTHFYSANAMTGYAWISVVPLVVLAFLLSYIHKYKWDTWTGSAKRFHLFVGCSASVLYLGIPLIFLSNINLMLFPDLWSSVRGFFSSLSIGNVFPRYFHFLAASLAITGLYLVGRFGRKGFAIETALPQFTRVELRRLFYRVAFWITLAQLFFGTLLLLTLPNVGLDFLMVMVILSGATVVIGLLFLLARNIRKADSGLGVAYLLTWVLFSLVVVAMATGRHLYRENAVAEHKRLITDESTRFRSIAVATQMRIDAGLGAGDVLGGGLTGEKIFLNCAACHAVDKVLAAPSLVEIGSIYEGNPSGIVAWAKAPGRKRLEFAPMPSFAHLGDEQLLLVAEYMLDIVAPGSAADTVDAEAAN